MAKCEENSKSMILEYYLGREGSHVKVLCEHELKDNSSHISQDFATQLAFS